MRDYNFGNILFELRKQKQLTQSELGEILGISNKTISKWENGTTKPGIDMLYKLSEYFEISVDELISGRVVPSSSDSPSEEKADTVKTDEQAQKGKKKRRSIFAILLIIFAVSAVLTVSAAVIIDRNKLIKVPNVIGKDAISAEKTLESLGFKVGIKFEYSYTVDNGIVISQSRKSGENIKKHSEVILTVSAGIEKKEVPTLIGLTLETAQSMLADLGFEVEVREEFSDTYEKGTVYSQSHEAGTKLKIGSKVRITVSKGKDLVDVPTVTGLTQEAAETLIYNAGLKIVINIKCSDNVSEGIVMTQSIKGGDTVSRGSTVELTVSAGVANKTGNTNANLLNLQYVAFQGDWVYYRNTSYDNCLYKMRNDGSEKQIISSDRAFHINVAGEWIYYMDNSYDLRFRQVYRIKLDGTGKQVLLGFRVYYMMVVGDYIYYMPEEGHGVGLWRMTTDGRENTQIISEKCRSVNIIGDWIYYLSYNNQCVHKVSLDGKVSVETEHDYAVTRALSGDDDHLLIFYDSILYKVNLSNDDVQIIEWDDDFKRDSFHYYGGNIYYVETRYVNGVADNRIMVIEKGESQEKPLFDLESDLKSISINVANGWIYFENENDNYYLYRVRTDGTELQKVYN